MDQTWKEKNMNNMLHTIHLCILESFALELFPSKFLISLKSSQFELDFKNNDCANTVKFSYQVREKGLERVVHEKLGNRIKTTWWSCWKRLVRELSWSFCIFTPFGAQSLQSKGKITGQLCFFFCLFCPLDWTWCLHWRGSEKIMATFSFWSEV